MGIRTRTDWACTVLATVFHCGDDIYGVCSCDCFSHHVSQRRTPSCDHLTRLSCGRRPRRPSLSGWWDTAWDLPLGWALVFLGCSTRTRSWAFSGPMPSQAGGTPPLLFGIGWGIVGVCP